MIAMIVRSVVMRGIIRECLDDPLHCTTSFMRGMSEIAFLLAALVCNLTYFVTQ
jgi:hypothetical protein